MRSRRRRRVLDEDTVLVGTVQYLYNDRPY